MQWFRVVVRDIKRVNDSQAGQSSVMEKVPGGTEGIRLSKEMNELEPMALKCFQ